jgi:flavoprotein
MLGADLAVTPSKFLVVIVEGGAEHLVQPCQYRTRSAIRDRCFNYQTFRVVVPESWCCIDCGVNTAPGCPTRAEVEQAFDDPKGAASCAQTNTSEMIYAVREMTLRAKSIDVVGVRSVELIVQPDPGHWHLPRRAFAVVPEK